MSTSTTKLIQEQIDEAVQSMLFPGGGSSRGKRDIVRDVILQVGREFTSAAYAEFTFDLTEPVDMKDVDALDRQRVRARYYEAYIVDATLLKGGNSAGQIRLEMVIGTNRWNEKFSSTEVQNAGEEIAKEIFGERSREFPALKGKVKAESVTVSAIMDTGPTVEDMMEEFEEDVWVNMGDGAYVEWGGYCFKYYGSNGFVIGELITPNEWAGEWLWLEGYMELDDIFENVHPDMPIAFLAPSDEIDGSGGSYLSEFPLTPDTFVQFVRQAIYDYIAYYGLDGAHTKSWSLEEYQMDWEGPLRIQWEVFEEQLGDYIRDVEQDDMSWADGLRPLDEIDIEWNGSGITLSTARGNNKLVTMGVHEKIWQEMISDHFADDARDAIMRDMEDDVREFLKYEGLDFV